MKLAHLKRTHSYLTANCWWGRSSVNFDKTDVVIPSAINIALCSVPWWGTERPQQLVTKGPEVAGSQLRTCSRVDGSSRGLNTASMPPDRAQANQAGEVLRNLIHYLRAQSQRHHNIDRLEERVVERGSARWISLKGRERAIVNQTNIKTISKATLEILLSDGVERIWTFMST